MAQAPAAIFKIPTESPQPPRGRARALAAARPKAASRVAGIETRVATRGDGEVIELDLGITVYPPRDKGGRWRAFWHEDGERQQCESVSEDKLAAKLEKVRQRLSTGAANMTKPGADLIVWYLNPDRLPAATRSPSGSPPAPQRYMPSRRQAPIPSGWSSHLRWGSTGGTQTSTAASSSPPTSRPGGATIAARASEPGTACGTSSAPPHCSPGSSWRRPRLRRPRARIPRLGGTRKRCPPPTPKASDSPVRTGNGMPRRPQP
jgi:hypothetical protein